MFNRQFGMGASQIDITGEIGHVDGPVGGSAVCGVSILADGTVQVTDNPTHKWHQAAPIFSVGTNYQVRASVSSGVTPAGPAMNTLFNLGTSRTWTVTRNTVAGLTTSTLLIEILTADGATVIDSATFIIEAALA